MPLSRQFEEEPLHLRDAALAEVFVESTDAITQDVSDESNPLATSVGRSHHVDDDLNADDWFMFRHEDFLTLSVRGGQSPPLASST